MNNKDLRYLISTTLNAIIPQTLIAIKALKDNYKVPKRRFRKLNELSELTLQHQKDDSIITLHLIKEVSFLLKECKDKLDGAVDNSAVTGQNSLSLKAVSYRFKTQRTNIMKAIKQLESNEDFGEEPVFKPDQPEEVKPTSDNQNLNIVEKEIPLGDENFEGMPDDYVYNLRPDLFFTEEFVKDL